MEENVLQQHNEKKTQNSISYNVMRIYEFEGFQNGADRSIIYRVACDCGDPQCDLTLMFTKDEDEEFLSFSLEFDHTLAYDSSRLPYYGKHWYTTCMNYFRRVWHRCSGALRLLVTGRIETSSSLLIHDVQHMESLKRVFEEGMMYMNDHHTHWLQKYQDERQHDNKE